MNNTSEANIHLLRNNLIKQMRSYSFLLVIGISLFIGYASVPAASAGYEIFYIGGVRGIYNSAWLGGMLAMLSTLLLWLFGFFMLRSQISEDNRLRVGQIIASTPISKLQYISTKTISNFLVLIVIELIMILAFMGMQLLRGEDYELALWDYIAPFLYISSPSLLVLAALTVFFDVFPGLKGVIGNIVFFVLWLFLSVISIASPNSVWDVYGLDIIRSNMVQEAAMHYDFIADSQEGGSFGYYPVDGKIATFEWEGIEWTLDLLVLRIIWVIVAGIIIVISSLVFNRFKDQKAEKGTNNPSIFQTKEEPICNLDINRSTSLSPIEKTKRIQLSRLVNAEVRIMLKGHSIWWYILLLGVIAASLFIPLATIQSWFPLVLIFPLAIWSQMGTREKYYFTNEMILSSCRPLYKYLAVWLAGILVTLLMSSGVLVHYLLEGQFQDLFSWLVAIIFIPTLGLTLGSLSGSRKLFEVIYMLWWYLGPVNDIPYLDFIGELSNHSALYMMVTVMLVVLIAVAQLLKDGHHRMSVLTKTFFLGRIQ